MKQKKYLWRRIFALSLALLLCLNTATAYAAPDTPTGSESTEAVSDVSVNEGDSNLTNKTEDTGKGTETGKTETEEGNKDSGDADSETGDADENGKNTANKPTEGKPDGSDGKNIVSDADASDTDTVVTDTSSEEKQPGEETPEETPEEETPEEEPEEMPEEVKAFLDAVARIPEEITPENLEEAGALLTAALDAYDVLTEAGYGERADVAEAYIRLEAAYAEVQAVLGDEEPVLYAAGVMRHNVEKSGIDYTFYSFDTGYVYTTDAKAKEYYTTAAKGKVLLSEDKQSAYEEGTPNFAFTRYGTPVPVSYQNAEVSGTNDVVDVTVTGDGSRLRIEFKPGTRKGTATVKVRLPFTYEYALSAVSGRYSGELYFWYEVTNGEDSDEKPAPPTDEKVQEFYRNNVAVSVRCIDNVRHTTGNKSRLDPGSYTIGEVEEYDGSNGDLLKAEWLWMCKVHVDQEYYLDLWNKNLAGSEGTHYLKDKTKDVYAPFYYFKGGYCNYIRDDLDAGWYCLTEDAPVYVDITETSNIPETDTITKFTKEVVKTAEEAEAAGVDLDLNLNLEDITFPGEDGTVEIPEDDYITLLYAITVEGSVGMKYKVVDTGAVWVGGSKMEATIPSGGKAVIYVTREFWADEINEEGYLSNTANVTWGNGEKLEDTEKTPAKVPTGDTDPDDNDETYTITINFLEEGTNTVLRDFVELTGYSEGDSYTCTKVNEEEAEGRFIPETITKDGKTYSLKEGQDNKLSGTVKGNVVIDLYYSSPEEPPQNVLTVTAEDVSVVYDGDGHPVNPVAKVGEDEVEAEISVVYVDAEGNEFSDAPVNAGTYKAKVTAKLDGYDDATCEATVTIAKRKLTVTTGSDSKTYDGTPLTNSTAIVVVEGGAVAGEEITATATGSRTEVGSAENTFVLNWGKASESNYEIVERRLGTLTVYAAGGTSNDNPEPTPPGPTPPGTTPPGSEPTPSGTTPAEPGPTPATPEPTPTIPVLTVEPVPVVPTTVVPTPAAPTATAALVSSTPEAAVLMDEDVPLANEEEKAKLAEVGDGETPLAGGKGASWALVNFALMNLAIFESLMLLIGYFVNTKNDKEVEEEKRKLKKKGIFRIVSLPIAIISLIAFILTEDITLPTAFVDKYTIVMLIIAVVQTVVVALSNKKYEEEEEEEERKDLQFAVG